MSIVNAIDINNNITTNKEKKVNENMNLLADISQYYERINEIENIIKALKNVTKIELNITDDKENIFKEDDIFSNEQKINEVIVDTLIERLASEKYMLLDRCERILEKY